VITVLKYFSDNEKIDENQQKFGGDFLFLNSKQLIISEPANQTIKGKI